jgi:hypothetical protein
MREENTKLEQANGDISMVFSSLNDFEGEKSGREKEIDDGAAKIGQRVSAA